MSRTVVTIMTKMVMAYFCEKARDKLYVVTSGGVRSSVFKNLTKMVWASTRKVYTVTSMRSRLSGREGEG